MTQRRAPAKSKNAVARMNARTGGFLGLESKFLDNTFSGALSATVAGGEMDPNAAGAQTTPGCISGIAIGTGESERDGRKAFLTSVHVRGDVSIPAATALTAGSINRVALVWDTQTNGAQLNAEDVFLAASNVEHSFRNLQFTKRFKVLKDQTFTLNPTLGAGDGTANDTGGYTQPFNWNVNVAIPVIFSGTTNSITSISDNSLHMVGFTSAGGTVNLRYESRVRFTG